MRPVASRSDLDVLAVRSGPWLWASGGSTPGPARAGRRSVLRRGADWAASSSRWPAVARTRIRHTDHQHVAPDLAPCLRRSFFCLQSRQQAVATARAVGTRDLGSSSASISSDWSGVDGQGGRFRSTGAHTTRRLRLHRSRFRDSNVCSNPSGSATYSEEFQMRARRELTGRGNRCARRINTSSTDSTSERPVGTSATAIFAAESVGMTSAQRAAAPCSCRRRGLPSRSQPAPLAEAAVGAWIGVPVLRYHRERQLSYAG